MLEDGIYKIKTQSGDFAEELAVQVRDGQGRPCRLTTAGDWGWTRETFEPLSDVQAALLAEYGLHANQAVAWHTA